MVLYGGGSGVIGDIPDNQQMMGYPAVSYSIIENLYSTNFFEDISLYRPMMGKIYRMAPVETQRGCPYACRFCNSPEKNEFVEKNVCMVEWGYESL